MEQKEKLLVSLLKANRKIFPQKAFPDLSKKITEIALKLFPCQGVELKLPDFLSSHGKKYKSFRKNIKENEKKNCRKNDILKIQLNIENKKMGVLLFYGMKKNSISEEKIKIIKLFATQVSLAIANLRYIERMRNLAISDELTGLYNQGYFYKRGEEELSRASRRGSPLSLLFLDIDGLKKINDTHGHITGDKVLRLVAEKIKQSIRKTDIAFRYGGDEFVVILPDTPAEKCASVSYRIKEKMREINLFPGLDLSIGIASYPEDGKILKDLLDEADRKIYLTKKTKKLKTKHGK